MLKLMTLTLNYACTSFTTLSRHFPSEYLNFADDLIMGKPIVEQHKGGVNALIPFMFNSLQQRVNLFLQRERKMY